MNTSGLAAGAAAGACADALPARVRNAAAANAAGADLLAYSMTCVALTNTKACCLMLSRSLPRC